jgi:hypothetical protein
VNANGPFERVEPYFSESLSFWDLYFILRALFG